MIASFLHIDCLSRPLDHDDVFHAGAMGDRMVNNILEGNDLAPAKAAISSDNQLGLGVFDPAANGLRAEA